jgi:S-methylmethionine-dependent homocysteine/selenocysteine methylase
VSSTARPADVPDGTPDDAPDDETDVVVLDGGMGQELLRTTGITPSPMWSAAVMHDRPDAVVDVHRAYIDAGAGVLTINAYSATRCRLEPHGRGDDYERLQRLAVELAQRARHEAGRDGSVRLAGCLSPYRWSYRTDLAPPFEELVPSYVETAQLQAPGVDLFLCETMGSAHEAAAAATGAASTGLPVWVSWTLADDASGRLRSGETVTGAVAELQRRDVRVEGLLVNCSLPESIDAAVAELAHNADTLGVRCGAYANGFGHIDHGYSVTSTVDALDRRADLDPAGYLRWVERWVDAGLTVLGGCCEIGPDHIRAISDRFHPTP